MTDDRTVDGTLCSASLTGSGMPRGATARGLARHFRCAGAFLAVAAPVWLASPLPATGQTGGTAGASQGTEQAAPRRAPRAPITAAASGESSKVSRVNQWTVGVAGGLLEGTFSKYAADLGRALDDGDNLRVLPIVTYGAVGNVTDLLYLRGIDIAITYSDVLDHFRHVEKVPNIERRIHYIMPMFDGEVHILARPEIKTIRDLEGKKVGFNTIGSAANYTGGIVFDRLGIKADRLFVNNSIALEGMRKGEVSALVHVVGKPNDLFTKMKPEPGFHFLPIEWNEKFQDFYAPTSLVAADYPNIIAKDTKVETISVSALLAVYNWAPEGDRHRRVARFIEYLFQRFDKLKQPPYQPKWKEMNIAGKVPGWTRYWVAEELVKKMQQPVATTAAGPAIDPALARQHALRAAPGNAAEQERLFQQFLEWSRKQQKQ
jgi:TRAP-type uncharacterized transport system substrate-binding protein